VARVAADHAALPVVVESPLSPVASQARVAEPKEPVLDPLANLADRERKRSGFQYNSEPDPKKLI
jgi:hypothetical protein